MSNGGARNGPEGEDAPQRGVGSPVHLSKAAGVSNRRPSFEKTEWRTNATMTRKLPTGPIGYWPILMGALAALAIPFLFAPHGAFDANSPEVSGSAPSNQNLPAESAPSIPEAPIPPRWETGPALVQEAISAATSDAGEVIDPALPHTPLEILTADWRYVGGIVSPGKSVARIQRMESPNRIHLVKEGGQLEGVAVVEIASATVLVSLGEDSRILPLEQGPAFNLEEVFLPEEAMEDPEILASVVFAQTLGKYLLVEPDFSSEDSISEPTEEALHDAMDSLSQAATLVPPQPGETPEEWVEAAAEGLGAEGESELDPSQHPLSEEDRLTLLGVHLLRRE